MLAEGAAAIVPEIIDACLSMAGLPYDGEPVDQLQHALQCAHLAAERAGGDDVFIVACLLHDTARAPAVAGIAYDGPREHHGEAGPGGWRPGCADAWRGRPSSTSPPSGTSSPPIRTIAVS